MPDTWINGVNGVPQARDFATTTGQGPALCIDKTSGIAYYLMPGDVVTAIFGSINVKAFGAKGDGVTNDSAAFVAAIAFLKSISNLSGSGQGSPRLFIPEGKYYLGSTTLEITHGLIIEGDSLGEVGGQASQLIWDANTTGIRVQSYNTTGASGTYAGVPGTNTGSGTIIRNLMLIGGFASTEAEAHGIHLRARAVIENVRIESFEGDGIFVKADGGQAYSGNANSFKVSNVSVANCRIGLYVEGGDANAGTIDGFDAITCRQAPTWDKSGLGNNYKAPHAAGNAAWSWNTGAAGHPCSYVSQGGNIYFVIRGQEAGASTNAPSGTTADNAWWAFKAVGGPNAGGGIPAWFNGINVRTGGGYIVEGPSNMSTLIGPYLEADQIGQIDQLGFVLNPIRDSSSRIIGVSGGAQISPRLVGASTNGIEFYATARFQQGIDVPYNLNNIGPRTGTATDNFSYLNNTNVANFLTFQSWNAGTPQRDGTIISSRGNGFFLYGLAGLVLGTGDPLGAGGTNILTISSTGADLASGKVLKINGTQVVTARQTGIAANATDLPTAITLVNDLKAKLITHGLVS